MLNSKYVRVVDRTVPGGDLLDADFDYKMVRHGTGFSKELALALLEHIATGKSLVSFCRDKQGKTLPGRPSVMTVMRWRAQIPGFQEMYKAAAEDRADTMVDEMVDIAYREDDPRRAKVIIDTMKWVAARYKPGKYGDRVAVTGAADGAPIQVERVLTELSDADLLAIAQQGKPRG